MRHITCFILQNVLTTMYMVWFERRMLARVLGKGLELLSANGSRFEINQLLFTDDTALVIGTNHANVYKQFNTGLVLIYL